MSETGQRFSLSVTFIETYLTSTGHKRLVFNEPTSWLIGIEVALTIEVSLAILT